MSFVFPQLNVLLAFYIMIVIVCQRYFIFPSFLSASRHIMEVEVEISTQRKIFQYPTEFSGVVDTFCDLLLTLVVLSGFHCFFRRFWLSLYSLNSN